MPNTVNTPLTAHPTGDLLLEIFSEEIPARLQQPASAALEVLVTRILAENQLTYREARSFATPRRLVVHVRHIPHEQPEQTEERRGPRVGCAPQAVDGFLKSVGLSHIDQLKILHDPKKGDFYGADLVHPSRTTVALLSETLPACLEKFSWPKSMRWGKESKDTGSLRWIRPLHAITCTFSSPHTKTCTLVPF